MRKNTPCILVIDAGTGGCKCTLFDIKGKLISSSFKEWYYQKGEIKGEEYREFDACRFWKIICLLINKTISQAKISSEEIIGVTSTSQREGVVFLDENDQEIYAGPNLDFRGKKEAQWLEEKYAKEIYFKTGHWPDPIFAPARLLWFKNNKPNIYKKINKILMINDWILFKLSGNKVSEPTNASESLMFNIVERRWDEELLKKFGFNSDILAPVRKCGAKIGKVSKNAAEYTDLEEGTPVYNGAADTQSAVLGTGGLERGHITVVTGTSAPIQVVVEEAIIDEKCRTWSGCYVEENKWVVDSNVRPAGVLYRWLRNSVYRESASYDVMNIEAEKISPGSNGVLACLGPSISNVKNQKDFTGVIRGLEPDYEAEVNERGIFSRSILENIAFAIRANIEQLEEIIDQDLEKIHLTGGLSNSNIFLNIVANTTQIPLYVAKEEESTSLGAAILVAREKGYYKNLSEAKEVMVETPDLIETQSKLVNLYENLYKDWLDLYYSLTGQQNKN